MAASSCIVHPDIVHFNINSDCEGTLYVKEGVQENVFLLGHVS